MNVLYYKSTAHTTGEATVTQIGTKERIIEVVPLDDPVPTRPGTEPREPIREPAREPVTTPTREPERVPA